MSADKIAERIQKLIALSKNNSSAAEAATAIRIANKLMAQYKIGTEEFAHVEVIANVTPDWKVRSALNKYHHIMKSNTGNTHHIVV